MNLNLEHLLKNPISCLLFNFYVPPVFTVIGGLISCDPKIARSPSEPEDVTNVYRNVVFQN